MNAPDASLNGILQALRQSLQRHPRRLATGLAVLLLGTGVTAFGVAPLVPDVPTIPVRQIVEAAQPVELPQIEAQTSALDDFQFNLFRSDSTRSSDSADSLLKRLGIDDPQAGAFLRSNADARLILSGRPGKMVIAEATDDQELLKLVMRWPTDDAQFFKRLVIERQPHSSPGAIALGASAAFTARIESAPYSASARLASGTIQSSLFAAIDDARLPESIGVQIAEIFSGDIDFRRALRKGDRFNVVYETLEADGEPLRAGRVLSAEFVNNGKTHQAMWFQPLGNDSSTGMAFKGGYFGLDGQSLRRGYLSAPLEFSRVSSGFSMRMHPILRTWRAHLGTDFAAASGTPARTVGDGTVSFAGVQGGYGNVVFVQHRNGHETVYAHLSQINVTPGQAVSQGQTIGLVGQTGWATGPHLHFEFRVNGVHQDPMTMAQQSQTVPVPSAQLPAFRKLASGIRDQLQAAASLTQSRME